MAHTDTISRIAEMTMLTLRMPRKLMLRSWWKISMDVAFSVNPSPSRRGAGGEGSHLVKVRAFRRTLTRPSGTLSRRRGKIQSNPERLELAFAAAVDQRGDRVGHGHRGEQRSRNTDEQRDAETLDRTGAHGDQSQRRQQVGDV